MGTQGRRVTFFVVELIVLIGMLLGSGPLSLAPTVFAGGKMTPQGKTPATAPDHSRFQPVIQPKKSPVGPWHSPKKPTYKVGSSSKALPGATNTPQRTPGEQPDLRQANSRTTLNKNGSWTTSLYPVPVNYQDAQGKWQLIDTTVAADTSVAGYAYGNRANSWHVYFAARSGGAQTMRVQFPNVDATESLAGAASVAAQASGPQITYARVLPQVDLLYADHMTNLEEALLLHSAQAPASYTLNLHIPGVTAQLSGNMILFTDASNHVVLVLGGITMYESDATGTLLPQGQSSDNVRLTLSGSGPDFSVTLTPDAQWLSAPGRHFPVAIDPTYSGADQGEGGGTNGNIYGDTFNESANPTWAFYNNADERIGNCTPTNGTGTSRTFIKFPVGSNIPTHARVTSATLQLYQVTQYTGGTGQTIDAYTIGSAWDETTLTWNNQPTNYGSMVGTATTSSNVNVNISFNLTLAAYNWWQLGYGVNGLALRYANESNQCQWFAADDYGSHLPTLTINYLNDLTPPSDPTYTNVHSVTINGGAPYTNNPTVSLVGDSADPGSDVNWSSNWSTVNGVGSNGTQTTANWSVDASHSMLVADSSSCGGTACWAQTFFTTIPGGGWPTFTVMFKTDYLPSFQLGVVAAGNNNERFMLLGGTSGFTSLQYSTSGSGWSTTGVSVPLSANTWYYGQITFPLGNAGEFRIWPVGQARPTSPTVYHENIAMTNPGLNVFLNGDNGPNLHHAWIGNVNITSVHASSDTTGFGVSQMAFSNDNTNWACPAPASGTWCVYAQQPTTWALSPGDGVKTVYAAYLDNSGFSSTGDVQITSQILLDTTPPTTSITAPATGAEVRGEVTVTGTAVDPPAPDGSYSGVALVWLYADGQQIGLPVQGPTPNPTFVWDTATVTPGEHTLTMRAVDYAGNLGPMSAGVTVNVDTTGQMPYETFATRQLPDGGHAVSVNAATGDALVTHTDLSVPDRGPGLDITRTYNDMAPANALFGYGWTSELDMGLVANGDGTITFRDASGGLHTFWPNGSGGYLSPPGLYAGLVQNGDGTYTLTSHDQSRTNFSVAGYLTSIVDRNGSALTIAYSGLVPTTVTDAAGRTLTLTTSGGHITAIAAPGARNFGYAYDGNGNLTQYTDPAGIVTQYAYDSLHRLTGITLNDQSGVTPDQQTNVTTTLTYDSDYRLVDLVDPMGYDVGISYQDAQLNGGGQVQGMQVTVQQLQTNPTTTPSSSQSLYEQTTYLATTGGLGTVAQLVDAMGGETTYTYDGNGNVTKTVDPDNDVTTDTYDGNGNVLTQTVDPGGSGHLNLTTTSTYDASNNLLTQTDPAGIVTTYAYDAPGTGDLVQQVQNDVNGGGSNDHTNVTTSYTYDRYGEVLTATDPKGIVTQYGYDSQGDRTSTVQNYVSGAGSDSQTNVLTSATFDDLGQPQTSTDALGVVAKTVYDIRGGVMATIQNYVSGGGTDDHTNVETQYGYDALERQVSATDPLGVVTETQVDADGRTTASIQDYVSGGGSDSQTNVTSATAYDAAGNATLATDPKGNTTTTSFDADNRAYEVVQKGSDGSTISDNKTTYDAAGRVASTQIVDGQSNPLTSYTYDAAGRKATETDPPANPGAGDATGQSNVSTYTYDADGNLLGTVVTNVKVSGNVSDEQASYDPLGHLTQKIAQAGTSEAQTTSYGYDADGNATTTTDPSGGVTTQTVDSLGRVITIQNPDLSTQSSTYDANGHQLTSTSSGGTTTTTYDPMWRVSSHAAER